jgi:hypothetical protein
MDERPYAFQSTLHQFNTHSVEFWSCEYLLSKNFDFYICTVYEKIGL